MSNTEPTIPVPGAPVVSGNTLDFEVCGNPNMIERVVYTAKSNLEDTFEYGYVDPSTNTMFHSHQMKRTKGTFL